MTDSTTQRIASASAIHHSMSWRRGAVRAALGAVGAELGAVGAELGAVGAELGAASAGAVRQLRRATTAHAQASRIATALAGPAATAPWPTGEAKATHGVGWSIVGQLG